MQTNKILKFDKLDSLIKSLWSEVRLNRSQDIAIDLANEIMRILGIPEEELETEDDVLDKAFSNAKFKNQKMESWYVKHRYLSGGRMALYHYDKDTFPVESKFYQLTKSATKAKISATTQMTSNWEDSDLTMLPDYKIGIDFFLNAEANSLLMVISKYGNLRVLEMSNKLSNTQIEIFNKLKGSLSYDGIDPKTGQQIKFEPQRTIHQTLWNALELKEVNRQFYYGISDLFENLTQHLKRNVPVGVTKEDVNEGSKIFAIRLLNRLVFIWFLRKKDIINENMRYFTIEEKDDQEYYEKKLKKLFFSILNTPIDRRVVPDSKTPYLNGGLFEVHENDWTKAKITFPSKWFFKLYNHLNSFNFTIDESSPEYEQIAIDPEMLGRVFENLLASIVPETSKTASERNNKGAFYTPRDIVTFMNKESLKEYLKSMLKNPKNNDGVDRLIDMSDSDFLEHRSTGLSELWGNRSESVKKKIIESLNKFKVLDPACGSGAFPLSMMQLLVKTYDRLSAIYDKKIGKLRLGRQNEKNDVYNTKLYIINKILFGSDIEPMAIEISKLRAWLSLIIDNTGEIEPLPNLDFNFVCANSLIPLDDEYQITIFENHDYHEKFLKLKNRFFNAHSLKDKKQIKDDFYNLYDSEVDESESNRRIQQLRTWQPFESIEPAHFFDSKIMFSVDKFDLIIGNPPYIGEKGNRDVFNELRNTYYYDRYYMGKMDYYYFFFHRGIDMLKENGVLCFITTNYFTTADGAKRLREDFYKNTNILKMINFNNLTIFDSAKGQHDMITLLKKSRDSHHLPTQQIMVRNNNRDAKITLHKILKGDQDSVINSVQQHKSLFSDINNNYYIRFANEKKKLDQVLSKLYDTHNQLKYYAKINQGLISGADKFTKRHKKNFPSIPAKVGDGIFVHNKGQLERLKLQNSLIKPFYKNSEINRWSINDNNKLEIFYYNDNDEPTDEFIKYISKFKPILQSRREFRDGNKIFYDLHRKRDEKIFCSPKIVAPQRSYINTFAYHEGELYASADVYFITAKDDIEFDPLYLIGILNSELIYFWLLHRGKRKGDMLELYRTPLLEIPIAKSNKDARDKVRTVVKHIISNINNENKIKEYEKKLDHLVYDIYDISLKEINLIKISLEKNEL